MPDRMRLTVELQRRVMRQHGTRRQPGRHLVRIHRIGVPVDAGRDDRIQPLSHPTQPPGLGMVSKHPLLRPRAMAADARQVTREFIPGEYRMLAKEGIVFKSGMASSGEA